MTVFGNMGLTEAWLSAPDALASVVTLEYGVPVVMAPLYAASPPEQEPTQLLTVTVFPAVADVALFQNIQCFLSAVLVTTAQALPPVSLSTQVAFADPLTESREVMRTNRTSPAATVAGM